MQSPLQIIPLIAVFAVFAVPATPVMANENLVPVDDTDRHTLEASASAAFSNYLDLVDAGDVDKVYGQVLDPGNDEARGSIVQRLLGFISGRNATSVCNERAVVRALGDWALVVYQYDLTFAGKTTTVITTAWMIQWEGCWRQFIIAPDNPTFWEDRRSEYEQLQNWFDEHAAAIASRR